MKRLLQSRDAQAAIAWVLGCYLRFALGTTRWRLLGEEHFVAFVAGGRGIAAFWHERLPLMPALWRRTGGSLRGHVLISRHRDGVMIASIMDRFGIRVVHGSSTHKGRDRGGAAGFLALLDAVNGGGVAVITPDGPRGPRRQAAGGVVQLAAQSGAKVLPCAAQVRWKVTLGSWDRMVLPLPFGRGVLVCGAPVTVARNEGEKGLQAIARALTEACDRADAACG